IPDGVKTTVSTATFTTNTAGGVQKGTGNIVLLSTGTSDLTSADAIDLLFDFTGMTAGTLSYGFKSVLNPSGNRNASLRAYPRTEGVAFTELPDAAVLNFSNSAVIAKPISLVQLPASFTNSPTARIRFYEYNGSGGSSGPRPKASIDSIAVTATPISSGGPS